RLVPGPAGRRRRGRRRGGGRVGRGRRVGWRAIAVGDLQSLVGTGRLADDVRHAAGAVKAVRVRDADTGGGLRVGAGRVVVTAGAGPGHVVEDVARDLPRASLVGVEGAQDVLGVPEVVV